MAVKYGVHSLIMNSPNGTKIQLKYCMQSFARLLQVQRKTPNNACRAELGQYPLLIRIEKKSHQILQPSKNKWPQNIPSHSSTMSRDETREESPQPAGSEAQFTNPNQPHRASGQHSENLAQPNHHKTKIKIYHLLERHHKKNLSKLQCNLALNRQ